MFLSYKVIKCAAIERYRMESSQLERKNSQHFFFYDSKLEDVFLTFAVYGTDGNNFATA